MDHAGVGGHEAVHVSPYLQDVGIQGGGDDGGGVVGSSPSKVGGLIRVAVGRDESRQDSHAGYLRKRLTDETRGEIAVERVLAIYPFGLDHRTAVHPFGAADQCGYYIAAQTLSIRDDDILGLLAQIVYQIDAEEDGAQLLKQRVHRIE